MLSFRPLATALLALAIVGAPAVASAQKFSDEQRSQIETIIKEYLVSHPEVLEEASEELGKRQAAAQAEKHQQAIKDNADIIYNSPRGVTVGNKNGDVTMVEFFDYNCGYCKRAMTDMMELMKDDPNLKVVLKEFPVLGPPSVEAAQVAIAVRMQDPTGKKYLDFHQKLLGGRGQADKARARSREGRRPRPRQDRKGHEQPGSARHHRRELQARGVDGHERHAELCDRQAGGGRRGRPRHATPEDQHRTLRQGQVLSAIDA